MIQNSRCPRTRRELVLLVAAAAVAGCATSPAPQAAPPSTAAPVAAVRPPAPPPAAPAPPEPAVVMTAAEIQRAIASVLDQLQDGQEDLADATLKKVLQSDANNRAALSLSRQIHDDPLAMLGRESFSYRVQPGESLSKIAGRFLNDVQLFYVLARYNKIQVPRNLAGGQLIRVPGKGPPPPPAPPPAPAPAPSPAPPPPPPPPAPAPAPGPDVAAKRKADQIVDLSKKARACYYNQDLDCAVKNWDAVLALDPDNRNAVLERQKAVQLREKLGKFK